MSATPDGEAAAKAARREAARQQLADFYRDRDRQIADRKKQNRQADVADMIDRKGASILKDEAAVGREQTPSINSSAAGGDAAAGLPAHPMIGMMEMAAANPMMSRIVLDSMGFAGYGPSEESDVVVRKVSADSRVDDRQAQASRSGTGCAVESSTEKSAATETKKTEEIQGG